MRRPETGKMSDTRLSFVLRTERLLNATSCQLIGEAARGGRSILHLVRQTS
jgi:hypothetical protein